METVACEDVNGGRSSKGASKEKIGPSATCSEKQVVESVVYQLVRVEGDGRLVPATDDEVMEVEHMLEVCNNDLPQIEDLIRNPDCISNEVFLKTSSLNSSEGGTRQGNTGATSQELNARAEESNAAQLSPGNTSLSAEPASSEPSYAETHPEPARNDQSSSKASISDICPSSKPNFSLLKGEICLDNLTIRELQETFRAAFGRQTSVKDKLWLKRRITMGLTNSCDVPLTSFVLKEKKVVRNKVNEEVLGHVESGKREPSSRSRDHKKPSSSPASLIEEEEQFSGKRLRETKSDCDEKDEDVHMEQIGPKRVRKPTRRYIEELSDVETKDCSLRLISSVKSSAHGHSSPEAQIRPICNVVRSTTLITRQVSLGGSFIQIPYVSRERRRRPRKDFLTLMDVAAIQREKLVRETPYAKEQDPELENIDSSSRDYSDDYVDTVPTSKGATRRKHHRAWTLSEVMKLVEGVSRYGAGRWSEIKRLAFASYTYRTSVDLKDKWRNLLKASFSQGPIEKEAQQSRKHNNSIPIPAPILVRVRELAEMHRQPGIGTELGHGKFAGNSEKIVQESEPGFL